MKQIMSLLLALTAASLFSTSEAFPVETYVNIHMPNSLHKKGGYQHSLGEFGFSRIASGSHRQFGSMALHLYSVASDLCHVGDAYPLPTANTTRISPYMLLAPRGKCTFAVKARHAQLAGAAGLLIANDCNVTLNPECEELPVIADDGSGMDVSIPIVLLTHQDVTPIQQHLVKTNNNGTVLVDLKWHPKPPTSPEEENNVHFGVWVDLSDNNTVPLMQQIKPLALSLQNDATAKAHFYPSYMLFDGLQSGCLGRTTDKTHDCYQMCTHNGRYCYPSQHVPGEKVVTEILRRICIWNHHGEKDAEQPDINKREGQEFWDYITYFDAHCRTMWFSSTTTNDEVQACVNQGYEFAKLNTAEVQACMVDTGPQEDGNNNLLDAQLKAQRDYGLLVAPTVWANGHSLHWEPPTASTVMQTICQDFQGNEKMPALCQACIGIKTDNEVVQCAQQHGGAGKYDAPSSNHGRRHHVMRTLFWIVFSLGIVGGVAYVGYTRYILGGGGGVGGHDGRLGALSDSLRYAMLSDQGNPDGPHNDAMNHPDSPH